MHFSILKLVVILFAAGVGVEAETSSVLIFGDSTVDPGNNNYIATPFRSNFWPYGKDFLNHTPTGRFTNGRLTNDYIGQYYCISIAIHTYINIIN